MLTQIENDVVSPALPRAALLGQRHRSIFISSMFLVRVKSCTAAFLFAVVALGAAPAQPPATAVRSELIVRFKPDASDDQIEHGLKLGRLKAKRHLNTEGMQQRGETGLTLLETDDIPDRVIERLKNHPAIDFIEPNFRYKHHATSNDPYVTSGSLWGVYGDLGSPANAFGSQALEAWSAGYVGANSVYVAVLDEGIDINHAELSANIWTNPFDPPDGLDNDGNGYIDDIHGWDFAGDTNVVFDPNGDSHGTHIAGTIGAKGGNGVGIAGVNWNVTIIPAKFLAPDGGTTFDAVQAIDYLVGLKNRHNINLVAINASWGGAGYSQALHTSIIRAAKAGILFVAAAGNAGLNIDVTADYPANYDTRIPTSAETAASYDSVIAVAAIDSAGALATFSNYGASNVDIGAPGVQILSTLPNGYIGYMNGTSMAAPHVTGAAALYASTHPAATPQSIRTALLGSALPTPSLTGKTVTGGRLNLSTIIAPPLPAPTGVAATAGNASVALKWNAVAGANSYVVLRSLTSAGIYSPVATVSTTTFNDTAVLNGITYYYRLAAVDVNGAGNQSGAVLATPFIPAPAGSTFVRNDDLTAGSWKGFYGSEGAFAYPYGTFTPPAYLNIRAYKNYPLSWSSSTSDLRALQKTSGTDRFAAAWHSIDDLYFYLNFTDGAAHRVSFYFVDYERAGRQQLLEFYDNISGKLLASEAIANFENGRYSTWNLQGNIRAKLTRIAGPNCVLSALFFDSVTSNTGTGPFVSADSTTSGTWKGVYGTQGGLAYPYGYFVPPSYAQLSAYKNYGLLWSASTTDLRAVQKPSGTDRIAGAWNSVDDFYFNLRFNDTATHRVSFYFVDYDRAGRQQKLEIIDMATGKVLDTRLISNFENGVYYTYNLSGNIRAKVTRLAGPNCVMSTILFDAPAAP
jgi:subtilisin family serine protease